MPLDYKANHFQNERRDRFVITTANIVVLQLLAYNGVVEYNAALIASIASCFQLIANYFSKLSRDLFPHATNIAFGITPYLIVSVAPSDIGFATLLSLCNAVAIGYEHKSFKFRFPYLGLGIISWVRISLEKDSLGFSGCINLNIDQGVKVLFAALFCLMMVAASHSDLEMKALQAYEDALVDLRNINAKYEQTNKKLKELLDEKDNFILLFSHETRNPLNILMGNLSILLTECESPRQQERIIRSKFCAELLLHNLNNILDTGKLLNKGNLEIAPTIINLNQYLYSLWEIIKTMVVKKQLKPTIVLPQTLPSLIRVDSQKISQIILNLISNAVKFTASGSVSLNVRYLEQPEITDDDFLPTSAFGTNLIRTETEGSIISELSELRSGMKTCYIHELARELTANSSKMTREGVGYLKFEVADTGCGIKEEDIEKLFQKFSQVDVDVSQRQLGSGLGLWISKTLARLLKGDIRVYSKYQVGTVFVVIVRADYTTEQNIRSTREIITRKMSSQRILLVDDDPYNLEMHFQMLKALGHTEIDLANDGQELINLFRAKAENYYKLILTDINMPKVNGIDAVRAIRQFERASGREQQVKVGFVTGHSNNKDKLLCEEAKIGASFYLSKPLKIATLQGVLQEVGVLHAKRRTFIRSMEDKL